MEEVGVNPEAGRRATRGGNACGLLMSGGVAAATAPLLLHMHGLVPYRE